MSIAVFGSINVDITAYSRHLPRPGQTIHASRYLTGLGGKGANQAAAAACLGSPVQFIGRVGADGFGQTARASLMGFGVDCTALQEVGGEATGIAIIGVDEAGENVITVVGGANLSLTPADAEHARENLSRCRVLLLQNEIPPAATAAAASIAKASGAWVVLDPAPAPEAAFPPGLLELASLLTPNEIEAEALTGIAPVDAPGTEAAAARLHAMGAARVILKLGARGAYLSAPDESLWIPAFAVPVVDTVAAGDCFNGGLAHALSTGASLPQACRFAAACAALSTTRPGAAQSAPRLAEVEAFLHSSPGKRNP